LKNYARKVYLWPHDECGFPGLTQELIQSFDDVLWLSKWQRMHWASGYPTFAKYTKTFGNGVNLEQFQSLKPRSNPYSCIYGSNYARGLEVLLDCWPQVKKRFPKATLDIYYGWQHWQQMTPEKEQKLRTQVAQLKTLDVQEHGLVSHEELNRAYEKASFWTYPCTMIEVFCITALRAQLAGAIPVIIEGSALPETVRHGYKCSKPEEYAATLIRAMEDAEKISLQDRKPLGDFIRKEYTWEKIARDWKELFDADLSQPPSLSFKSLETASKAS
jgi:glycosyltransferase involved in cell wall biosynthesis